MSNHLDLLAPDVRREIVTDLVPEFAHAGPCDTPAGTLVDAAWKLRNGYDVGGSNTRRAIAGLLENVAHTLSPGLRSGYEGSPRGERLDELTADIAAELLDPERGAAWQGPDGVIFRAIEAAKASAWAEARDADHTPECRINAMPDDCMCPNPYGRAS